MENEREPLLPSPSDDIPTESHQQGCRSKPCRLITIEPILIFVAISSACTYITTQYIYEQIADQLNYTDYFEQHECHCNESQHDKELQREVQEKAALYVMFNSIAFLLPSMFSIVLVGSFTDKSGRKYGMLPQILFCGIRLVLQVLNIRLELPLWVFILGSAVGGFAGGEGCITMSCFAYVADVTTKQQRSLRMFVATMATIFGGIFAALVVSQLVVKIRFFYTLLCIIPVYILAFLYTSFVLPESVTRDPTASLFQCDHIRRALHIYTRTSVPPRAAKLTLYLFIITNANYCLATLIQTSTLYFFNQPFCWHLDKVGYFMAYTLLIQGLGGLLLVQTTKTCLNDNIRILIGCMSSIAFYIALGLSRSLPVIFSVATLGVAMFLVDPMARSAATKLVLPSEQGGLQATFAPVEHVGSFIASVVSPLIYTAGVEHPGLPHGILYFTLAGLGAVNVILIMIVMLLVKLQQQPSTLIVNE